MFGTPSAGLLAALRDFVFRHQIFVEAREVDDGFIFTRLPSRGSKRLGPRRHFEVFLRSAEGRVRFFTLTCGSEDQEHSRVPIDFPEKVLLRPAEAAIEYEECGRDAKRFAKPFPNDPDAAQALFGYVRSESRLLVKLLGDSIYRELLRLVRGHRRTARRGTANRHPQTRQRR